jgi:hypothetical protein
MLTVEVNALLATIGYGLILGGLFLFKTSAPSSGQDFGKMIFGKFNNGLQNIKLSWLLFVAGFVLELLSLWIH